MMTDGNNTEHLRDLLEQRDRTEEARAAVAAMAPADLADLVEELPPEQRERVFDLLQPQAASDLLAEIDAPYREDIVRELPSEELALLAERMAPDEATDLISELEEEQGEEVLALLPPGDQREIQELLQHGGDTAGGLMTPEVLACVETATVGDVIRQLKRIDLSDPVFYVYVLAPDSRELRGFVSLQELVTAGPQTVIRDLCHGEHVYAATDEDQQEVARKFRRYDLWVMPVVDERHRLVGRVTVDDIIDGVHEEADEDLAHMVGAPDIESEEDDLLHITRLRLPWLLITMFAGLLNSVIIRAMMKTTNIETLAVFVPAILAMGGNSGMQSSAICIRGIALNESRYRRLLGTMWREIRVGLTLGITCGTIAGAAVWSILLVAGPAHFSLPPGRLALAVGLAMANAMSFATCFGAIVPILLHRLRVDPALASGPFITTSNDLSATLIYFGTCLVVLGMG